MLLLAAALLTATPATFGGQVAAARPGDTLRLAPGDYGTPDIKARQWSPALTIDAGAARFTGLLLTRVEGLRIKGGQIAGTATRPLFLPVVSIIKSKNVGFDGTRFSGSGASGVGITVRWGEWVTIDNADFTALHRGVVFNQVTHGRIANAKFHGLRMDGINIAASHDVLVDRIECTDFTPAPKDHPDCVQLWSVKGKPPTSDIVVRNSRATGEMQGFSGFDSANVGFDRIRIENNYVRNTFPHGVALVRGRDSKVTGNDVGSLPGARWMTAINIRSSPGVIDRDNKVGPRPPKVKIK